MAARDTFTDLKVLMSSKEFGDWINIDPGQGSFYNGLELTLWLWLRIQKR
jgi:hypothetical protein